MELEQQRDVLRDVGNLDASTNHLQSPLRDERYTPTFTNLNTSARRDKPDERMGYDGFGHGPGYCYQPLEQHQPSVPIYSQLELPSTTSENTWAENYDHALSPFSASQSVSSVSVNRSVSSVSLNRSVSSRLSFESDQSPLSEPASESPSTSAEIETGNRKRSLWPGNGNANKLRKRSCAEEVVHVIKEITTEYTATGILLHNQRVNLFRALVCYLFEIPDPEKCMLEAHILGLTVHSVAQAIMSANGAPHEALLDIAIEPSTAVDTVLSTCAQYSVFSMPKWVIAGLRAYYLGARPFFISADDIPTVNRFFPNCGERGIVTQLFFYNSKGSSDFRPTNISSQFMYKTQTRIKGESGLESHIAAMMPLSPNPNFKFPKMTSLVSTLSETVDDNGEFSTMELKAAVKKRQDAQRYIRQTVRAEHFVQQYPRIRTAEIQLKLSQFYETNCWDKTDVAKVSLKPRI